MYDYTSKTVLAYKLKNGKCQLFFQSFINKERSRIKLGYAVRKSQFNSRTQRVNKKNQDAELINEVILSFEAKAKQLYKDSIRDQIPLTKSTFEDKLLNRKLYESFTSYMYSCISASDMSLGTIKNYKKAYNYLCRFQKDVKFFELDANFLKKWNKWLRKQKVKTGKRVGEELSQNYIHNLNKQVKRFLSDAVEEGLIKENPYKYFKIEYLENEKDFLELAELKKYVKLYDTKLLPKHLQDSLQMFLFMCSTGLRISDTIRLSSANIKNKSIVIRVQKTRRHKLEETFPLSDFARRYLPQKHGKLFRFKHGQQQNRNLAVITKYLNIEKEVTSHTARHTFAMMYLQAGGKVEVLQALMGHTDINTTMIYVHIAKSIKNSSMDVFDEFMR